MKIKITQCVKSAVNAYIVSKTLAECEREKVDNIARIVLKSSTYYADIKFTKRSGSCERMTDPARAWRLKTEEHHDYLINLKKALQIEGYIIKSIPGDPDYSYSCPALVAESIRVDAEHLLIKNTAKMIGDNSDLIQNLLCAGLDTYYQFIDMVVKMVVNMPGFTSPLTKKTN